MSREDAAPSRPLTLEARPDSQLGWSGSWASSTAAAAHPMLSASRPSQHLQYPLEHTGLDGKLVHHQDSTHWDREGDATIWARRVGVSGRSASQCLLLCSYCPPWWQVQPLASKHCWLHCLQPSSFVLSCTSCPPQTAVSQCTGVAWGHRPSSISTLCFTACLLILRQLQASRNSPVQQRPSPTYSLWVALTGRLITHLPCTPNSPVLKQGLLCPAGAKRPAPSDRGYNAYKRPRHPEGHPNEQLDLRQTYSSSAFSASGSFQGVPQHSLPPSSTQYTSGPQQPPAQAEAIPELSGSLDAELADQVSMHPSRPPGAWHDPVPSR